MTIDHDQMKADMDAGTPGPWTAKKAVIGYDYGILFDDNLLAETYADIRHENEYATDESAANARRIARLPDLEAAYLVATARADRAEAELAQMRKDGSYYKEADIDKLMADRDELAALRASLPDVRRAERKRCAQLASDYAMRYLRDGDHLLSVGAAKCAAAISALDDAK